MSRTARSSASLWVFGWLSILHFAGVFCENPVRGAALVSEHNCPSPGTRLRNEPNCSRNKKVQCRNTCDRFILCNGKYATVLKCPPHTEFSTNIGECDHYGKAKGCITVSDNEPTSSPVSEPDQSSTTVHIFVSKPELPPGGGQPSLSETINDEKPLPPTCCN